MSDVRAAYDPNRLPWLNDTVGARAGRGRPSRQSSEWRLVALSGFLALILVATLAYWAGMRSVAEIEAAAAEESRKSEATTVVPEPLADQPAPPQVQPAPAQELQPIAPPPVVRMNRPQTVDATNEESGAQLSEQSEQVTEPSAAEQIAAAEPLLPAPQAALPAAPQVRPSVARPAPLTLWPADVSAGASGRVVRIGTFPSRLGAKRAWSRIIRVYPGMTRLKAVVVSVPSIRNGRTYYRLQFGTTSQAHSAVLCQRMRIVGQSCVVVGTPAA